MNQGGSDDQHEAPYLLPHNLQEVNRLDFQHYLSRQLLRGNYLAPVERPDTILDVGSGTGRWLLDLAKDFPAAKLYGFDLKAPSIQQFPENCRFVQGDILLGLPFPSQSIAFVHQRLLTLAIPIPKWPVVIGELIRVTRPGGWIELVEGDLFMQQRGHFTERVTQAFFEIARERKMNLSLATYLEERLHAAKLVQIKHLQAKLPFGSWGGRLGQVALSDQLAAIRSLQAVLAPRLGVDAVTFEDIVNKIQLECEQNKSYSHLHVIYGRRPPET